MTDENKQAFEALNRVRISLNDAMRAVAESYMVKAVTKTEHDLKIEQINMLLKDIKTVSQALQPKPSVDVEGLKKMRRKVRHNNAAEYNETGANAYRHGFDIGYNRALDDVVILQQGHLNIQPPKSEDK